MSPRPWIAPAQIAKRLRLTVRTVQTWCAEGVIPGARLIRGRWYVPRVAWERWIADFESRSAPHGPEGL